MLFENAWIFTGEGGFIHGNSGSDFSDGDAAGLENIARYLTCSGVTGFAPASMTLPYETLDRAFATAAQFSARRPAGCARLLGVQMEGPFFGEEKGRPERRLSASAGF